MELKRDMESPELMDDMSEEFGGPGRPDWAERRFRNGNGGDPHRKPLIYAGAAAVVLITLLIVLFGGGDKSASKELDAVKAKLDGVEKRLAKAEGVEQKILSVENQMKSMDNQLRALQGSVTRLEGHSRSLKEHVEKLAAQPPAPKPPAPSAAPQKKAPGAGEKKLHEVKRGETLFSIAKKYNMKPEDLRSLNSLSKNDPIRPGQRLIVVSGG